MPRDHADRGRAGRTLASGRSSPAVCAGGSQGHFPVRRGTARHPARVVLTPCGRHTWPPCSPAKQERARRTAPGTQTHSARERQPGAAAHGGARGPAHPGPPTLNATTPRTPATLAMSTSGDKVISLPCRLPKAPRRRRVPHSPDVTTFQPAVPPSERRICLQDLAAERGPRTTPPKLHGPTD